jgi:hypothetical protein
VGTNDAFKQSNATSMISAGQHLVMRAHPSATVLKFLIFQHRQQCGGAELLSFGRPGVAPIGCACSKASQASQPGQDAKELREVHRSLVSLVMPSLDS